MRGAPCIATHLVDGDSVHVAVVDEPDDLVGEQLPVVLARQVRFRGLGADGFRFRFRLIDSFRNQSKSEKGEKTQRTTDPREAYTRGERHTACMQRGGGQEKEKTGETRRERRVSQSVRARAAL